MRPTDRFAEVEIKRTGIEPVTSGLQTQTDIEPHLTRTNQIGMT
jgi:hypothetical protein